MGNNPSSANNDTDERNLGVAHLDASSPKVIHSRCVSNDEMKLILKGNSWYSINKEGNPNKEELCFRMETGKEFDGSTQLIRDDKGVIVALFQKSNTWTGKGIRTLVYRPIPTFDDQQHTQEVYKASVLKKQEKKKLSKKGGGIHDDLAKYYLFARIQSSAASKCDASYALLQVNIVYNDPDFAKFQEPPLYRAAKVINTKADPSGFRGIVMDGMDHGGETVLGKVTTKTAHVSNGVDILAVIALGLSVNQSGKSARGVDSSDVV
jgi:hypothetical protein